MCLSAEVAGEAVPLLLTFLVRDETAEDESLRLVLMAEVLPDDEEAALESFLLSESRLMIATGGQHEIALQSSRKGGHPPDVDEDASITDETLPAAGDPGANVEGTDSRQGEDNQGRVERIDEGRDRARGPTAGDPSDVSGRVRDDDEKRSQQGQEEGEAQGEWVGTTRWQKRHRGQSDGPYSEGDAAWTDRALGSAWAVTTSIDSLFSMRPTTRPLLPSAPSSKKISVRPSLWSRTRPKTGSAQVDSVSSASTRVPSSKSAARTRMACRKRCSIASAALTELGPLIGRSPAGARSGSEREIEDEHGNEVDESSFSACSAGRAGRARVSAPSGGGEGLMKWSARGGTDCRASE